MPLYTAKLIFSINSNIIYNMTLYWVNNIEFKTGKNNSEGLWEVHSGWWVKPKAVGQ